MSALFVTGTDTGVGKTTVSCALLRAAVASGLRAVGLKPAETGCALAQGELWPADARALQAAGNLELPLDVVCPYRYREPLAPGIAAAREGGLISLQHIARCVATARALQPDVLLVEGAGGLLVPISDATTMADLARLLALPVLIVAREGLGTINHTALTVEVARQRGLHVHGVVLCCATETTASARDVQDNVAAIERLTATSVFGVLSRGARPDATRDLDLARLLGPAFGAGA